MGYFTVEKCETCGGTPVLKRRWWQSAMEICWGHNQKRVSELNQLKVDEISSDDVLLISDVSKKESKQIRVGDLVEYVRRNNG